MSWEDAERVTRLIKKANPKRVVVERYARTRCPHTECAYRIVEENQDNPKETQAYCTCLDIVVKAKEAKEAQEAHEAQEAKKAKKTINRKQRVD